MCPIGADAHVDAVHVDGDEVGVAALDRALDQVGLAEEVGDERAARVLVELGGRAHLLDDALVHHRDRVGHGHGLLLVVGDVHEREAHFGLDPLELDLHRAPQLEVERAERLVEQEHLGLVDEGPGQRDPLLLAAGELGRLLAPLCLELDQGQHLVDLPLDVLGLPSTQPEGDVLVDVQVREQRVVLEHRVDRPPVGLGVGDVLTRKRDRSRGGGLQARHHPQRRGLAAARGAEKREERAAGYVEIELLDGGEAGEPLGELPQPQSVVRRIGRGRRGGLSLL